MATVGTPQEAADSDSDQPDQGLVEDKDEPISDEPDKDLAEQVAAHLESLSLNPDNPTPNEPSEPPSLILLDLAILMVSC